MTTAKPISSHDKTMYLNPLFLSASITLLTEAADDDSYYYIIIWAKQSELLKKVNLMTKAGCFLA
jgi:hypothetical protein